MEILFGLILLCALTAGIALAVYGFSQPPAVSRERWDDPRWEWVEGYYRRDGSHVRGHWRHRW